MHNAEPSRLGTRLRYRRAVWTALLGGKARLDRKSVCFCCKFTHRGTHRSFVFSQHVKLLNNRLLGLYSLSEYII